jgi:hypothetical protein
MEISAKARHLSLDAQGCEVLNAHGLLCRWRELIENLGLSDLFQTR